MYGVEILLERSLTPYILSLYLPSSILVAISWLSYLLSHPLLRLSVELVVTMVLLNMLTITRSATPPANTITAVEIWLLGCLFVIIISILELLIHTSFLRSRAGNRTRHVSDTCRHPLVHQSPAVTISRCQSTTSSRANIMQSSTEEFVQVNINSFFISKNVVNK